MAKFSAPLVCGGDAHDTSGNGTNRVIFSCVIKGGPHTRVEVTSEQPQNQTEQGRETTTRP